MKCNYVERQADGTYKFYRIDQDWVDGQLKKNYIEIPKERIPKHKQDEFIRNWFKR